MGGRDRFDSLSSHYKFTHKSKKCYVRMFIHFIEIAVRYNYNIYLKKNHNYVEEKGYPKKHIKFRKSLIKGLINLQRNKLGIQVTCAKSELVIGKNYFNFSLNDCELKNVGADITVMSAINL